LYQKRVKSYAGPSFIRKKHLQLIFIILLSNKIVDTSIDTDPTEDRGRLKFEIVEE